MDRSFVSAFGEKFAFFCTSTSSQKLTNETDLKYVTWGVTNSRMLDVKADGYSHVVSLSFGVRETSCSQDSSRQAQRILVFFQTSLKNSLAFTFGCSFSNYPDSEAWV